MKCHTFTEFYQIHRNRLQAALFDIDGTLSIGSRPLPGAARLLEMMAADNFPFLLLTNDSCHSTAEKAEILQNAGLPVTEERIISAGDVLKQWAKSSGYRGELFFQCGQLGNPPYAAMARINVTDDPARIDECYGVLCGEGLFNWQASIEAVFNYFLVHPEAPLVVANPDSYWPSCHHDGMGIGAGAIARFIISLLRDAGVKKEPVYLGKPYAPIYQYALETLRRTFPYVNPLDAARTAMVGDSLASDIRGGNANGLFTCLVLTGITDMTLAENATAERRPAAIFESV